MAGVGAAVNGVAAPLYYVSPGQLNLQIPYETAVNGTATLQINNNGQAASQTFPVATAAPGVFTDHIGADCEVDRLITEGASLKRFFDLV